MLLRRLSFNRDLFRGWIVCGFRRLDCVWGYQYLAYPVGRPLATPQVTLLANFLKVPLFDGSGLPMAACSG